MQYLLKYSFLLLLLSLSALIGLCFGLVYNQKISVFTLVSLSSSALLLLGCLYLSRRLFNYVLAAHVIFAELYLPIGLLYGKPNIAFINAALENNLAGWMAFLTTITPSHHFSLYVGLIVIWFLLVKLAKQITIPKNVAIFCWLTVLACLSINPILVYSTNEITATEITLEQLDPTLNPAFRFITSAFQPYSNTAAITSQTIDQDNNQLFFLLPIAEFSYNWQQSISRFIAERRFINAINNAPVTWQVTNSRPSKQIYVLILGESARRDYMSVYGYPLNTTPFAKQAKGIILDGLVSPSYYTKEAVGRMLARVHSNIMHPAESIITLANTAGFNTSWLSAQGEQGFFAFTASLIGKRAANKQFFIRSFNREAELSSEYADDSVLLPPFKQLIQTQSTQPQFIVLHLMGSHAEFCRRLNGKAPEFDFINQSMSCYLTTLKQTDAFIEQIISILKQSRRPYSVIYFSDHGLAHPAKDGAEVSLAHHPNAKQSYAIPAFMFADNIKRQYYIKAAKSGVYMLDYLAGWLGIEAEGIIPDYDIFSTAIDPDIRVFNGQSYGVYSLLTDDPAILPNSSKLSKKPQ